MFNNRYIIITCVALRLAHLVIYFTCVGLSFFITEIPYEIFTYNELDADPIRFEEKSKDVYPYMVNMPI